MSTSPPSGTDSQVVLSSNSQRQTPAADARRRQSKFVLKQVVIIAVLGILVVGCAKSPSLLDFAPPTHSEETVGPGEIGNYSADDLPTRFTEPASIQGITETPPIAQRRPLQNVPSPPPFPGPEPTFTVAAPPLTATPAPTATSLPLATLTPTATLQSDIKYVVIISIDGLRPDALELADTPTLDNLRARGAYSPNAQTVSLSITLPSHASMLTGMTPEKHGILWGLPYIGWPGMSGPSLFSVAHEAGLSTAMVFGKEKLNYLCLPDSADKHFVADAHDPEVKDRAVEFIQSGLNNVLFIHFPDTDRVGHAYGWMSDNQLYAVNFVDGLIDEIVSALETEGYMENTLLIITADHGGHGSGHGDDSPVDRTIPWLALGPGVPAGVTLSRTINTYDTAATALYALKLPIPEVWDGQPVVEIFQ